MSFEIKLCESTDLAMTIFNMFRLNTVNFVEPQVSDEIDSTPVQYQPSSTEEYASTDSLYDVHQRLFGARCTKVVINDLFRDVSDRYEHREVKFELDLGLIEIAFTVWVYRIRENHSEWTAWQFKRAEFVQVNVPEGEDYTFFVSHRKTIEPFTSKDNIHYHPSAVFNFSKQQRKVFGQLVCSKVMYKSKT